MRSTKPPWSRTARSTPLELLDAAIERIERIDPALNAVVMRWFDHARDTARADIPAGPFRGVPFLIKDLHATYAGQPISYGNVALKNEKVISDADTTMVSRCRSAGLVIAGRTNTPRVGKRGNHRTGRLGRDPQPVGHRPLTRRLKRWFSSRGRQWHGAGRTCQRPRRLHPDSGFVLWAGWLEAQSGADHARSDPREEILRQM